MTLHSRHASNVRSPYGLSSELAALVTSCRNISDHTEIEALVETLLVVALGHADWERGLFFLTDGRRNKIQAEAIRSDDGIVNVALTPALRTLPKFPLSVLRYVLRTDRAVCLDDAVADNQFSDDDFLRRNRVRSLLCLPLLTQRKIVGVLYLENHSSPHAFDADRLAMLELLSISAAVMFKNLRLRLDRHYNGLDPVTKRNRGVV